MTRGTEILKYIKDKVNLPMADIRRIAHEGEIKNWTNERALKEARALYIKEEDC